MYKCVGAGSPTLSTLLSLIEAHTESGYYEPATSHKSSSAFSNPQCRKAVASVDMMII